MNTKQRQELLQRFADADRWLTRVYDTGRTDEHRLALWNFLMKTANPKLKSLLQMTRHLDEVIVDFWDSHKN